MYNSVPAVSKQVFLKSLQAKKETKAEVAVPFLRDDFAMKTAKHWDNEDDDDVEEQIL